MVAIRAALTMILYARTRALLRDYRLRACLNHVPRGSVKTIE
jgi:hypothetical protein